MPVIDKEKIIHEWAKSNPFLTDRLLFDYLNGEAGSCSISPLYSDDVVKTYIDGSKQREYTFALQIMLEVSNTTDNTNVENMFILRKWQSWIREQNDSGNYPNFGKNCSEYELVNLNNMPSMAVKYENNMAKYQFYAKLSYLEEEE